jgi:hypothetical protein
MESGFHGVRTHWIWGFMAFGPTRRARMVMRMVPDVSTVRFGGMYGLPGGRASPSGDRGNRRPGTGSDFGEGFLVQAD